MLTHKSCVYVRFEFLVAYRPVGDRLRSGLNVSELACVYMHNVCACMHAYRRIYLRVCVFDSESDVIQDALAG